MFNKIIKTLLPVFWMIIIFVLSSQPYDSFPSGITNAEQAAAHIFLYAVLAYLIVVAAVSQEKTWRVKNVILFSVFFSVFYGITDEYHQGFVPGRYVSFGDLAFDFVGAVLGAFLSAFSLGTGGEIFKIKRKPKLLLHICCMGCGAYIAGELKKKFRVALYFYNPNIFPESEHNRRLEEAKKIAKKLNLKLIIGEYKHNGWLELIKGFEREPERGERCVICYRERLEDAAKKAKEIGFDYFTTTLTVSPRKDARAVSEIGNELAGKYAVEFLDKDFKKRDGFKKACELSKKLKLYRQNYCGCEFSYNPNAPRPE